MGALPRPNQADLLSLLQGTNALADELERRGLGNMRFAFGSLTITFGGNHTSGVTTTKHGLDVAPRIWTQPADFGALATGPLIYVGNIDSVNFDCKGQDAQGVARTGSVTVYWLAIA